MPDYCLQYTSLTTLEPLRLIADSPLLPVSSRKSGSEFCMGLPLLPASSTDCQSQNDSDLQIVALLSTNSYIYLGLSHVTPTLVLYLWYCTFGTVPKLLYQSSCTNGNVPMLPYQCSGSIASLTYLVIVLFSFSIYTVPLYIVCFRHTWCLPLPCLLQALLFALTNGFFRMFCIDH